MRSFTQIFANLPLPGFEAIEPETDSRPRVWRNSTTEEVKWPAISKKQRKQLQARARLFDQQTAEKGQHGGILKHAGIRIWDALLDHHNYRTGQLDPSIAAIARAANAAERTVSKYLKKFRELGMLDWIRRCTANMRDGRHVLEQATNAYILRPVSEWLGFRPPMDPPPPARGTWGDPPRMPSAMEAAELEKGDLISAARALEQEPANSLEAAFAKLARSMAAAGKDANSE